MKAIQRVLLVLALASAASAWARQDPPALESAAQAAQRRLTEAEAELNRLREQIADEKLPLGRELGELQAELGKLTLEYQETARLLDSRTLDLNTLRGDIEKRKDTATYLSNLLNEYVLKFESRLHIAEKQLYEKPLEAAKLAPENKSLTRQEIYRAQAALLALSLDRLHDSLGGTRFDGKAVDSTGLVRDGKFVLVGPAAIFRSADGQHVGTAEQRLGSLEPTVFAFADPADRVAADQLIRDGTGSFPLDPTLGNAHKIAATHESLWEHVQKGGVVMVPIFALAGLALLVALFKWIGLAFLRKPSSKAIAALLDDVGRHDEQAAAEKAASMRGPVGSMLAAGVAHLREPRELVEEIMYETVLTWRLRLQRFLPFIAVCAASAPLLGLLGTVTGIINTFKLITVFGAGDVKTLSGGISQALITTEYGLIVAIPSLLIHAFLSRKARGMIDEMEKAAVALLNQIGKTPYNGSNEPTRELEPVRATITAHGGAPQERAENPRTAPPRKAIGAGRSGQPES